MGILGKAGLAGVVLLGGVLSGGVSAAEAPITECDRLVMRLSDPRKLGAGVHGDKVDGPSAIKACEAAVEAYPNEERLWFQLGWVFVRQEDYSKSIVWYRKAADRGYAAAQYGLAFAYANGEGVTKDLKRAVNWYRKSAEQGFAWGQSNLGRMYGLGRGVVQDKVQALKWMYLSSAQRIGDANRDKLIKEMTPDQIAQARQLANTWKLGPGSVVSTQPVK